MKCTILFVFLFLGLSFGLSQGQSNFEKKILYGYETDPGSLAQSPNGNFFIGGHLWTDSNTLAFVLKTDPSGKILYTKDVTQLDNSAVLKIYSTEDNGFIAISPYLHTLIAVKCDSNGNTQWAKKGVDLILDFPINVIETKDHGFAFFTGSDYKGRIASSTVIKLDYNGSFLWSQTLPGQMYISDNHGIGVIEETDGSLIIAGNSEYNPDIIFAKISSTGNFLWDKHYKLNTDASGNAFTKTIGGGFIVCGNIKNPQHFGANTSNDILLAKFDSSGNILWNSIIDDFKNEIGNAVIEMNNKDIIVTATSDTGSIQSNLLLIHLNENGDINSFKQMDRPSSSNSVIHTIDDKIAVLASYEEGILFAKFGAEDEMCHFKNGLFNVRSEGNLSDSIAYPFFRNLTLTDFPIDTFKNLIFTSHDLCLNSSTPEINILSPIISLSPNPTSGIITVRNVPANIVNVTVSNILGESVLELPHPNAPDFTLDLSKLPPGTYFARFSLPNEVTTRKILKE